MGEAKDCHLTSSASANATSILSQKGGGVGERKIKKAPNNEAEKTPARASQVAPKDETKKKTHKGGVSPHLPQMTPRKKNRKKSKWESKSVWHEKGAANRAITFRKQR